MFFKVNIFFQKRTGLSASFFQKLIRRSLKKIDAKRGGEVSLVFTDERTIRGLNRKYRKKNKSTSILTFVLSERKKFIFPSQPSLLGEIIICPARARIEARREGLGYRKKITFLVIHGFLHLFGFDHKNDRQRKKMERMEGELINLSGK
ncbi:MAG: rRNA maturation RNase YbeY [Patescibacteria group bacterium]